MIDLSGDVVLLVTGDRKWRSVEVVRNVLSRYPENTTVIHGYADGLDSIADSVAKEMGFRTIPCPAHWSHNCKRWLEVHGPCSNDCKETSGRPAGVLRNKFMLETYKSYIREVLGFHDSIYSSKGTKDMLIRAQKAKKPTKLYLSTGGVMIPKFNGSGGSEPNPLLKWD